LPGNQTYYISGHARCMVICRKTCNWFFTSKSSLLHIRFSAKCSSFINLKQPWTFK
jgi:hypothetical protein